MEQPHVENGASCRLVRADGSEWRVTDLRGAENGLRVDAVRTELRVNGEQAVGEADAPSNGEPAPAPNGQPSGNGSAPGRLEDELLGRGDRLHWLGEDGDVVWSMKLPMDQARSA